MRTRSPILLSLLASALCASSAHADGGATSATATLITSNPYVDSGTTVGKGNDALLGPCGSGGSDTAEDGWYRLQLTTPAVLEVWITCGPGGYDTRMAVFDSTLAMIACNDDDPGCGSPYYRSRISNLSVGPGRYYIVVDGYAGQEGPYTLNLAWVPPCEGDSGPANPTVVGTIPFTEASTTAGTCDDVQIECELGPGGSAPDRWYSVSLDTTVLLDAWTTCTPSGLDTRIAVYSDGLSPMYCNDDDPACADGQSRIASAFLLPGNYFIVVEGAGATSGEFTVHIDTTVVDPSANPLLLPDIIVRQDDLYDNQFVTSGSPPRTYIRFSNGTANVGDGKFYVYGTGVDNGDGTENIMQRIYYPGGGFIDRTAGQFVFHPSHNHIHVEEWCEYRVRQLLPNDGVGDIVVKGAKTSFCILDLDVYDPTLPNYDPSGQFFSCSSTVQGLSVGWIDIYDKSLSGQSIDVTGVPAGTYWLESHADPNDDFLERDEANNTTRIKFTIGAGGSINPDPYETNESFSAVAARTVGIPNSPNLGPCDPERTLTGLTFHVANDVDYFRFYATATGTPDDFVRIDFNNAIADLSLFLLDASGATIASSETGQSFERIELDGHPAGWYFVLARPATPVTVASYSLTIDPPANQAPSIDVIEPAAGTQYRIQGAETFTVTWNATDPESGPMWAAVYANTSPAFDGNEFLLPTGLNVDASLGFHVVNTAYLSIDTYWFYVAVSDGGSTTGEWSDGKLKLIDPTTAVDPTAVARTSLRVAVPNPFNPVTRLQLDLRVGGRVQWDIFDVVGRRVHAVHSGSLAAGVHERMWDGRDGAGAPVASGVYFQRVATPDGVFRNKLVLLK
ncbi:MAG: pre-peptidase C-terminal domain-containing protein [Candidatus Latescibacteria bacterium]|nr:pre-peptidase C-terminal domain-containing protein [Candidatus Latescibacterota bacterium]